ncbi:6-phosphogluconolactonase [Bullifex porci]|uniref:6-phosphogluconolactonase n=1 Tax=Bullifex porci TaxID=2606638 RepID=UPI0023F2BD8F|nr:6-phosphogluconolactonase [Bullifex porci]MDD7254634.1 6-phosphogluconolactonase [Bullifex porci]MDY2741853.1 6-phosphogluconolactonase [Bullifex porci]
MNINLTISKDAKLNGKRAAELIANLINEAIKERGKARIVVSTGSSQFEMFETLIKLDVDWSKVEMFHLDEYVNLPESHIASFRKYLKERFVSKVNLKAAYFVSGEGNIEENISYLTKELRKDIIDVGIIGIGENGHIAFNDPPADFETDEAYKVVTLDQKCRAQQVGEGWFKSIEDVPTQAISMTPKEIMKAKHIVTVAPHSVKADAIYKTITTPISPMAPATLLKTHPDWHLFIDDASASKLFGMV